jgi:hypothetical protein
MREAQQVDLLKMPLTSEGNYLYQLLKTAGEQVTAYDVTGVLQIPTFALCAGEQVVAYSTDCDVKQALCKGLEQVLWWHQAQHALNRDNRKGLSLRDYPALPPTLCGEQLSTPVFSAAPETWSARKEWLLQKLWSHGMRVFVVPLDHDPTLARMVPFIVRVLVSGKELQEGE